MKISYLHTNSLLALLLVLVGFSGCQNRSAYKNTELPYKAESAFGLMTNAFHRLREVNPAQTLTLAL